MSRLDSVEDLVRAFAARDLETIRALADAGLDLDAPGGGGLTPLMRGVLRADAVAVEWILAAGADPDVQTPDGKTALDFARQLDARRAGGQSPRADLTQLLIAAGASAGLVSLETTSEEVPRTDTRTVPKRSPAGMPLKVWPRRPRAVFSDARSDRWQDAFEDRFEERTI